MNTMTKKSFFLTLISGILLDIPALIVFLVMIFFRIHYSLFSGKSYLLFFTQFKAVDYFPELVETPRFIMLFLVMLPVIFYIFNTHLFRGNNKIPVKSVVLFLIMIVLEIIYFLFSIQAGIRYQGKSFVMLSVIINIVFICVLFFLLYKNQKSSSYMANLGFNFLLILWFFWFAFPFFGEMGF